MMDGSFREVPGGVFVEICDEDGVVCGFVYRSSSGTLRVVEPDDIKEMTRYADTFKVRTCNKTTYVEQQINDSVNPKPSV